MKAIRLTNPKGETKYFTNVEFYEFKNIVLESKGFKKWSKEIGVDGSYIKDGEKKVNSVIIENYLRKIGYSWNTNQ